MSLFEIDQIERVQHVDELSCIEISPRRFRAGNESWHRTLPRISLIGMRMCFGAECGGRLVAVAAWSNPVARAFDASTHMELRRFAISPEAPENTATWMMKRMRRALRCRFPEITTLVSYSDNSEHDGTIYRAMSNWSERPASTGGEWTSRANRIAPRLKSKTFWWSHQNAPKPTQPQRAEARERK